MDAIDQLVIDFVRTSLLEDKDAPIDERSRLFEDGLIDSVGLFRLVTYLQGSCGVRFEPADIVVENFDTLPAIRALIELRKGTGHG